MPEITVIITAFNNEKYLARAIESVLRQVDYPEKDIILVYDTGSTDDTEKICLDYESKYPFIFTLMIPHCYVGVARNKGAEKATSQYIKFLDGDDELADDCISTLYNAVNGRAVVIADRYEILPNGKKRYIKGIEYDEETGGKVLKMGIQSVLYERDTFITYFFCDSNIRTHEDRRCAYLIPAYCEDYTYVETPVYIFHVNPGSITNGNSKKRLMMMNDIFSVIRDMNEHKNMFKPADWEMIQDDLLWSAISTISYIADLDIIESCETGKAWVKTMNNIMPGWKRLPNARRMLKKPIFKNLFEFYITNSFDNRYALFIRSYQMKIIKFIIRVYGCRGFLNYLRFGKVLYAK